MGYQVPSISSTPNSVECSPPWRCLCLSTLSTRERRAGYPVSPFPFPCSRWSAAPVSADVVWGWALVYRLYEMLLLSQLAFGECETRMNEPFSRRSSLLQLINPCDEEHLYIGNVTSDPYPRSCLILCKVLAV